MFSSLLIPLAGSLVALPTDTDHLRGEGWAKKAVLLLDTSGSMGPYSDTLAQWCPGMGDTEPRLYTKNEMLIAALLGCSSADSGVFDRYAERVEMALVEFGGERIQVLQDFTHDAGDLEAVASGLPAQGSTPMQWAMNLGGRHHKTTWEADPTTEVCDQMYLVLLTDGFPNTPSSPPYDYACDGDVQSFGDEDTHLGAQYLWDHDLVCTIGEQVQTDGTVVDLPQRIQTHTIGFGALGDFDADKLRAMAELGGDGTYNYASDAHRLADVFDRVLQAISGDSIGFSAPAQVNDGLSFQNDAFVSSFRMTNGPALGNMKRYCIYPSTRAELRSATNPLGYDPEDADCMFRFDDEQDRLEVNESPLERWSDQRAVDAMAGGAGERFYADLHGRTAATANETPVTADFTLRQVLTWDPAAPDAAYEPVRPDTISDTQAMSGGCEKARLLAYLHGYDFESVDCTTADRLPTRLAEWPMGAFINSPGAVLRYAEDCDAASGGQCFIVSGSNDGGLHFFDVKNGREQSMLVPGNLWAPGTVANHRLADLLYQPRVDLARVPLVDGGLQLFHDDRNGNGVIDGDENALLVFGLGLGGHGYYFMDVSQRPDGEGRPGVPDRDNPIYPIIATDGTWTENLRDTISTPAIGRIRAGLDVTAYAAFGSGTVWYANEATARFPSTVGLPPGMDIRNAIEPPCAQIDAQNPPGMCGEHVPPAIDVADVCAVAPTSACCTNPEQYDACSPPTGYTQRFCFSHEGAALLGQVRLSNVSIDAGDFLVILDGDANELVRVTNVRNPGTMAIDFWASEVRGIGTDAEFCVEVRSDGLNDGGTGFDFEGYSIVPRGQLREGQGTPGEHAPFFAVLNLDAVASGDTGNAFGALTPNAALHALFTSNCDSANGATPCYDADDFPALSAMRCPISAEPSVYEEGGLLRSFYFFDECAQLWKIEKTGDDMGWDVVRMLVLNEDWDGSDAQSRNFRKVQTSADLVITGCTGQRSVAIHFGTGNKLMPGAFGTGDFNDGGEPAYQGAARLTDSRPDRNIIGVIYDKGDFDTPVGLAQGTSASSTCDGACLTDVTEIGEIPETVIRDPEIGFRGWFMALGENERMLRRPVTLEGTSYFKTYQSTRAPSACTSGMGINNVYEITSCTAAPAQDGNGNGVANEPVDRRTQSEPGNVGSEIQVFSNGKDEQLVFPGDGRGGEPASVAGTDGSQRKPFSLYMWRVPAYR